MCALTSEGNIAVFIAPEEGLLEDELQPRTDPELGRAVVVYSAQRLGLVALDPVVASRPANSAQEGAILRKE